MKKIILFFGLLLSAGVASAQSAGDVQINGGIGYSGPGFMVLLIKSPLVVNSFTAVEIMVM